MNLDILKKSAAYTAYAGIVLSSLFPFIEPNLAIAQTSATDTVQVTLTVDTGISITSPADVTMSPNLGISANSSIGSNTWNVKTNDPDGYTLTVRSSTTPAMRQGSVASFADYTPTTPGTPETWNTPASSVEFGYSAYGTHVNTSTWGTGSSCGSAGVPSATQKWNGFSTTTFTVATGNATTTTAGIDTTVCYAAEQDGIYAAAGTYIANITATATVQ